MQFAHNGRMRRWNAWCLLGLLGGCVAHQGTTLPVPSDYSTRLEDWRQTRRAELTAPEGWLSLVGLFWLKEGDNRIGSGSDNEVVLPPKVASRIGTLRREQGAVAFLAEPGIDVRLNGGPLEAAPLRPDTGAGLTPDKLTVGSLSFFVLYRGDRVGVRVLDLDSPERNAFTGIDSFPAREEWVIDGHFEPYPSAHKVKFESNVGVIQELTVPGVVTFVYQGQPLRLEPVASPGSTSLMFVFADQTTGKETYGGGRFLDAELLPGNRVALDFNRAFNPPCVFTHFATCPLPSSQNRLPLRVEAGEKLYRHPRG